MRAEQEAEQWKAEKLVMVLKGVQEESKRIAESLKDQLAQKTCLIRQLSKAESKLQLEVDKLCAQNLLLQMRTKESRSMLHVHVLETACVNEASLCSASATGGLVLDSLLLDEVLSEMGKGKAPPV